MAASGTWQGGSSNNWTDTGNWVSGNVPNGLGDTATFVGSNAGGISLGGTIQLLNLTFTAPTASYNIGTSAGDILNFAAGGTLTETPGAGQTITAAIQLNSGTFQMSLKPNSGSFFDLKGPISGATFINMIGASANGGYQFDGANTYSGGTFMSNGNLFAIGVSAAYDGSGNLISGALGTGTVQGNTRPQFLAVNGDQTLGNALILGGGQQGMVVTNAAGTAFNMTFAGSMTQATGNKLFYDIFTNGKTTTFGTANTSATWTLAAGTGANQTQIDLSGTTGGSVSTLVLNYIIKDPTGGGAGIAFNNAGAGTGNNGINNGVNNAFTVQLNGASTYSTSANNGFGTQFNATNGTYQIGVSSVGGIGTSATSGPFGIGLMKLSSGSTTFQPHGGDRQVNNAIDLTSSGFFVSNDSSGNFNMTFAGPITSNGGRTISNSLANSATLSLGTAANPQIFQIGTGTSATAMQFRSNNGSLAPTVVWDVLSNGPSNLASINITPSNGNNSVCGPVYIMANNTYTGGTTVSGTGSGATALGLGGTLAGTGTVGAGGVVTLSGTTAGNQGGIVAPGSASATAGTLHVPGMQWNPFGRYAFDYNGNDNTVGSGVNDEIVGTGTLDLSNLGGTNQMDLNLNALVANSGATETYTIASFGGGVLSGGTSLSGLDITSDFTFSGTTGITPDVTVTGDGTGVQLTIVQGTPEPSSVLLVAGGVGLMGLRNRRRKRLEK